MQYNRKIAFHTLGCKLNYSETSSLANLAIDGGYSKVDFTELADFYVINTCSVTENADKECKFLVRQVKRKAPESKVVIIGCYAQLKPEEISNIEGVDLVLGTSDKYKLVSHLDKMDQYQQKVFSGDIKAVNEFYATFSSGDRTRTFLKIQDGCDYFCTFCTIPLARGRSRSQSLDKTIEIYKKATATGVKEIVLTGVNTGDFGKTEDGKNRSEETLFDFLKAIDAIEDGVRIRISSIEPNLLTEEIIDLVAQSNKLMPHFHIPLQSGSDTILEAMHRKYNTELYRNKIAYIRKKIPHAAIGVDVIVGFPEETDAFFEESYAFVHSLDVSYLHVFTYSERLNTRAAKSEIQVPIEERRTRNKRFRILSDKLKRAFYETHLNQEYPVLFEQENDNGFINGYTPNYIRVRIPFEETLQNSITNVRLDSVHPLLYVNANICQ
jgi:threonylcarbamoyladenosine tRNA methylthiotransferase MtaB